jgi:hypothetical protein
MPSDLLYLSVLALVGSSAKSRSTFDGAAWLWTVCFPY